MTNRLILVIFAICVLMALLLVAISFAEPVAGAGGVAHPDIPGMQAGGDGNARLAPIGAYAFAFQSLLLLLIVCLCGLGISERRRTGELAAYLLGSFVLMMVIWWQMYTDHQDFLATGTTSYFMGFPMATAWQMYGTWLGAIPLIVLYSWGFNKFVYTKEDEQQFDELLNNKRARDREQSEQ